MAITTKTDIGLAESSFFNRHRFDNHSSWLDRELRNKRRLRGDPLGHGFAVPREPAPARKEKPFVTQEYSMTSGLLLNRRYAQRDTDYRLETLRSDPHHFPNHLQVTDEMHYEDRRARSQHIDPRVRALNEIPRDRALRDAVPEEMVQNIIKAGMASAKVELDPVVMGIQFDPDIRPQKESVKQLNVDLSCCDLPAKEKPDLSSSAPRQGRDWGWCLGGRRPLTPPNHGDMRMHRSTSVPGTLSGKSLLSHQKGSFPGPFHGTAYIPSETNQRMRGGRNAENGMAGTFPDREKRPGV
jgi:hypothetical protein